MSGPTSSRLNNVVQLHPNKRRRSAFDELTSALILERARRGELDPAVVAALLAGVGLEGPK